MSRILKIDELVGNEIEANIPVEPKQAIVYPLDDSEWPPEGYAIDGNTFAYGVQVWIQDLDENLFKYEADGHTGSSANAWTADFFLTSSKVIPAENITFGGTYSTPEHTYTWNTFQVPPLAPGLPAFVPANNPIPIVRTMTQVLPPYSDAGETTYHKMIQMKCFKCGIYATNIASLGMPDITVELIAKNDMEGKTKKLCQFGVRIPTSNDAI